MLDQTAAGNWQKSVDAFLVSALDSDHSRRAYRRALDEVRDSLRVDRVEDLSLEALTAYRAGLLDREFAPASVSQRLAALRSFVAWCRVMGLQSLPADGVRTVLRVPHAAVTRPYQVLSEPETAALMAPRDSNRDRAILAVLLGAGLRVSEVVGLCVGDVLEDADGMMVLHVERGKGQRSRSVPVRDDVAGLVRGYLRSTDRRMGDGGPLFLANDRGVRRRAGRPLTTRAVDYIVKARTEAAGIVAKRVTPHALRHTYALRALRYTGNVMAVAKLLGHAQVSTTQRYVDHLALSELRRAVPPLPAGSTATAAEHDAREVAAIGSFGGPGARSIRPSGLTLIDRD